MYFRFFRANGIGAFEALDTGVARSVQNLPEQAHANTSPVLGGRFDRDGYLDSPITWFASTVPNVFLRFQATMYMKLYFQVVATALALTVQPIRAAEVIQPEGSIPVLHEVDVMVVGGSSGGVAAAAEAARSGAKVFLAAARPYLGEDICGTYRLWLEPGEGPLSDLAREVFKPGLPAPQPIGTGMPFQYSSSQRPSRKHPDTTPASLLSNGEWQSAATQSVQYDDDVVLTLDLGSEQEIRRVHLMAYQRPGEFEVGQMKLFTGGDGQKWTAAGTVTNAGAGKGNFEWGGVPISSDLEARARYLRIEVKRSPDATRLLLGEVIVEGAKKPDAPSNKLPIQFVTPMQVKRTLDQALIKAHVPFLFWCYATELLRDADGGPAGVIISTRSGRQAVLAKVIIDATDRSNVARMAGATFTPFPAGAQRFSRVVVGGPLRQEKGLRAVNGSPLQLTDRKGTIFPVHVYEMDLPMPDASFGSFANAEQIARDLTWTPEAVDSSEVLFQVPPDHFRGVQTLKGKWPGAEQVPLGCFQPENDNRILVLGGCADVSREAAAALLRPVNQMALGARIGKAAAALAAAKPTLKGVRVTGKAAAPTARQTIREVAIGQNHRATGGHLAEKSYGIPVIGEYDVVVVGGGTGGAPAGIAAARQGSRTLVVEYLHGLGGVGTMGYIASYYHGNRVGFCTEVDKGVAAYGAKGREGSWNPDHKNEWFRSALRKAGADIWYGVLGQAVVMEGDKATGIVVLTPQGRGVVLAKTIVDSTGNADIAAAAGAVCRYTDDTDVAVQGTGLPPRDLGQRSVNTDYTFVDDTDVFDVWRVLVTAKAKFKDAYDMGQLVDTRERRQIVGDFFFSPMDMVLGRTFPDTIVIAKSNFDTHGYIIHPLFMLRPPNRDSITVRVPWRCLLPRGVEGVIVTGLGVSAHRDAIPCIRMQSDVQNQGYAAGVAAAMAARADGRTRGVDIKKLQRHLVDIGNLPESVLTEKDSFPLPKEMVADAVRRVANDYDGLEIVLAHYDLARPMLRETLATAGSRQKLIYAHILGMMGDGAGAPVLAEAVRGMEWDKGWNYTGMGQFGPCMSPLDSFIIALGRTRSDAALAPILSKTAALTSESEFSHFRAIAIALETLADRSAAHTLAQLLEKPGMAGHAVMNIEDAFADNPESRTDTKTRNEALKELYLARALYRCGDHDGLGAKTLGQYSRDLHGHYARHAKAVLQKAAGPVE